MQKAASGHGRCSDHDKETFDLCNLEPGDHIVQESPFGLATTFWHHMIVESIDLSREQLNVIHYYHDLEPLWKWPSVCRTTLAFTPDSKNIKTHSKSYGMMLRSESSWFRQPGIAEVAEHGVKFGTGLSILVALIIEVVLLGHDCKEAKTKLYEGNLTRGEYCEIIIKRVCGALCSILGFAVGFILGGMILPVLGAFIGGAVGAFLGKEAGGKLGELLTPLFIEHLEGKGKSE